MNSKDALDRANLDPVARYRLEKIIGDLGLLCDLCRADLLLACRGVRGRLFVVAQAQPHSATALYAENRVGQALPADDREPTWWQSLLSRFYTLTVAVRGANVARKFYPVWDDDGVVIAYIVMDAYWLQHERNRRRSRVFQRALTLFTDMVARGELRGAEDLTPFGEHDGVIYVSTDRRIQYMSGIAAELYRNLGYRDSLIGRRLSELDTVDHQIALKAINERVAIQLQQQEHGRIYVHKAVPVRSQPRYLGLIRRPPRGQHASRSRGAFILVHDDTERLRTEAELASRMSLLHEVHHRVKNNLQVIASITRMQARRAEHAETRQLLDETVNRIMSMAVVHEFLSQNDKGTINLLDVAHRILAQVQQGLIAPEQQIVLRVEGPSIWLPADKATRCTLVINELVQNAIEHGMSCQNRGTIGVELVDHGDKASIIVSDDGQGLPDDFDLTTHAHLGLRIVSNMVERDLSGAFSISRSGGETRAVIEFSK